MKKRLAYLWEKYGPPRRIEIIDAREDLEKKPAIPEASSVVRRLKAATEQAHQKRRNIINKFKRHL